MKERRINIRINADDYKKLCELKLASYYETDSHAVRCLIRETHTRKQGSIKLQQRVKGHRARLAAMIGGSDD